MKPYSTLEDVPITEKSPKEVMALLPIWLLTMLELLWESAEKDKHQSQDLEICDQVPKSCYSRPPANYTSSG